MKNVTVEKRKNFDHIIGEEWTRDYADGKDMDFLADIEADFVDADDLEAVERLEVGMHALENGDFTYYVEIRSDVDKVIAAVEAGIVNLMHDYRFEEYNDELFIEHDVEGHGDMTLLFDEKPHIKEMRDEVYFGRQEKQELDATLDDLNGLDDQFDYGKVIGYRVDGGRITRI